VLGDQVGLTLNSKVDASGQNGGGTILIGGDFHGANPTIETAERTFVGSDAQINADALQSGDGEKW